MADVLDQRNVKRIAPDEPDLFVLLLLIVCRRALLRVAPEGAVDLTVQVAHLLRPVRQVAAVNMSLPSTLYIRSMPKGGVLACGERPSMKLAVFPAVDPRLIETA